MTVKMSYRWLLRERMAERGLWKTTQLAPLLAERGVHLSPAQIHRLVVQTPERLSLVVLAALCDILACAPNDLIVCEPAEPQVRRAAGGEDLGDSALRDVSLPKRVVIDPNAT